MNRSRDLDIGRSVRRGIKNGEIAAYYRALFKQMERERANGNIDRIEFKTWGEND